MNCEWKDGKMHHCVDFDGQMVIDIALGNESITKIKCAHCYGYMKKHGSLTPPNKTSTSKELLKYGPFKSDFPDLNIRTISSGLKPSDTDT